MQNLKLILTLPFFALVAACGGTGAQYVPLVDGTPSVGFQSDLNDCQALARTKRLVDGETREDALVGATVGALAGLGDGDGALGGAVVGAVVGGASSSYDRHKERSGVVTNCMKGRGHNVVG